MAISSRAGLGALSWESWCRELADAGVPSLQVREKDLEDRDLTGLTRIARAALVPPAVLLVNGRLDVAAATGADGVHLPADGLPTREVRRALGPGRLVGRSTHSLDEIRRARDDGADYVLFGPVHATPSKAGRLAPRGISSLAEAARIGMPVLALGGIDSPSRAQEALAAGAHGVAGIRAFLDPGHAAEMLAAVLEATELR